MGSATMVRFEEREAFGVVNINTVNLFFDVLQRAVLNCRFALQSATVYTMCTENGKNSSESNH